MDYEELSIQILDKLGYYWDDLAYNKKVIVSYGDLVLALLTHKSSLEASRALDISQRSLDRVLPAAFPSISRESAPWAYKLLKLLDIHKCSCCNTFKVKSEFYPYHYKRCKICSRKHAREYRAAHVEESRLRGRNHYLNNRHYYIAKSYRRKEIIRLRTPSWANLGVIAEIYNQCPKGYHVDHVIPLQGALVSGLHVEYNMQYLSARDNAIKGNKYMEVTEVGSSHSLENYSIQ